MHQTSTLLGRAVWVVLIVALAATWVFERISTTAGSAALGVAIAVFFPLVIVRLLAAASLHRHRRTPLLFLSASAGTWAVGAAAIQFHDLENHGTFPIPIQVLFGLCYLGIIGFLVTDPDNQRSGPHRAWWDVVVICGAAWCMATLVLVVPVRVASETDGLDLLTTLIFPFADVLLGMIVLSQVLLRVRTERRQILLLTAAFLALVCADAALAWRVSEASYDLGRTSEMLWGLVWALLTTVASRPSGPGVRATPQTADPRLLLIAGTMAVVVLILPTDATLAWYAVPPAVVTLAAVGARMALALRDARYASVAVELSRTDDLTSLPNRRALHIWLARALQSRRPFALMLLDLDRFKDVNDSLGHHAGDAVLQHAARQMRAALGEEALVARLGGDEFAVLLDDADPSALLECAHRLLRTVAEPVSIDGIEIASSGSIGIAIVPGGAVDPTSNAANSGSTALGRNEVLRRADVAMYQAKKSQAGAAIYAAHLDGFSRSRLERAEDLRRALSDGQFEAWYQPQVDPRTLAVTAVEALVRWRHPELGIIEPHDFLPAARRLGLMDEVATVVARQAIDGLTVLLPENPGLRLALNCSPPELLSDSFLPDLYAALADRGLPPGRLTLEITEESFLGDAAHAEALLRDVCAHGIEISMDDYGTGFSSLSHLRTLPVSELKIDQSLIRDIGTDHRGQMIASATIAMAQELGLRTVAEGVENPGELDLLTAWGVDSVQGFAIGEPMPLAVLADWCRARATTAAAEGPQLR